jgi:hypothetical protein
MRSQLPDEVQYKDRDLVLYNSWLKIIIAETPVSDEWNQAGQYVQTAVAATATAAEWTNTPTPTPTDTLTETPTATNTPTDTDTATDTPTLTDTPTVTNTPTDTPTITDTPTVTDTPTLIPTDDLSWGTPLPTVKEFVDAANTATAVAASFTATPTNTPTPTLTATETFTETPTATPTPEVRIEQTVLGLQQAVGTMPALAPLTPTPESTRGPFFKITHSWNTRDVQVEVWQKSTGGTYEGYERGNTSASVVIEDNDVIIYHENPTPTDYRIIVERKKP